MLSNKQRIYPPVSEWIFYKIYLGKNLAEELIIELGKEANNLINQGVAQKWFFIRYSDPNFHVRFRIYCPLNNRMFVLDKINAIISRLLSARIIHNVMIDSYHREFERFVSTYRDYIPNDHPILWTYGGLYSNKHINIALFNKENICELPMGSKLIRKPLRGNARYLDTELVEGVNTDHFRCSLPCKKYFRDVWSKFTAYYTNRLSREYADLGSYGLAPCETLEGLTIAEARDLAPYLTDEATISALAQEFKELNPRVERTVF